LLSVDLDEEVLVRVDGRRVKDACFWGIWVKRMGGLVFEGGVVLLVW